MTLFENICYDLLIEGKSPEEILSILKYKFKNVPESVIDNIFNIDPTKKKSFTQWVLLHYEDEKHVVDDALQNGMLKKLFSYVQSHQDVQLTKYPTIKDALYVVSDIDLLKKDSEDELANDFDIVYKSPEWVIAVPNTYEASHKLGENTSWCTAGYKFNDGRGYYDRYLSNYGGKYFINFDFRESEHLMGVDYPFKRYQFHFESNQFMDAEDDPVNGEDINMPDGVVKFYEENGYDVEKITETDEERWDRYYQQRSEDGVYLNDDLEILQAWDDNMEFDENGTYYYVYNVQYDDRDPISWNEVTKYPIYLDSDSEIIILNTNTRDTNDYTERLTGLGLSEYNGTQECEPMIVYSDNGRNYSTDENISYYKVFETYGEVFLAYITTKSQNDCEFHIVNKDRIISEPIPFDVEYEGVRGMYINDNVQTMYGSYNSDFLIEIVWDNGYHTLFNITSYNNANLVVMLDKPGLNSELFTVSEDEEGNNVIVGSLRNYYGEHLSDDDDKEDIASNTKPKRLYKELYYGDGINHNYVMVIMTDGNYNVYDEVTKQVVFRENFTTIKTENTKIPYTQEYGIIIGYNLDGKCALYSINEGKQLTPNFTVIDCLGKSKIFGAQNSRYENYIINGETFKIFGPFYGLTPYCYKNKIFVRPEENSGNKLLNIDTGEIEFQSLSKCTNFSNKEGIPIMFALDSNNECLMINYDTGVVLDRDIMINKKPFEIMNGYVHLRHSSTGKDNIVSLKDGKKLLPFDVSEISQNNKYDDYDVSHTTSTGYIAFRNESTEYIMHLLGDDNYELLPTQNGITTGQTTGIWNYRLKYGSCICFTIHDSAEMPQIRVTYNFIQNNIFVEDDRGVTKLLQTCEPEIQQRVMQALNPQKAQIVSQYNEMINRMKNLIK